MTPTELGFTFDGALAVTRLVPLEPALITKLLDSGIDFYSPRPAVNILSIMWSVLYAGFLLKMYTSMMQGPPDAGAGKRKDKSFVDMNLSFNDIAGQEKAKLEVSEICDMLKDPSRFTSVGARLPSGVLLVGPPGTGKTLLARVTAAEAKVICMKTIKS